MQSSLHAPLVAFLYQFVLIKCRIVLWARAVSTTGGFPNKKGNTAMARNKYKGWTENPSAIINLWDL
jgi:hypothetical protein